MLVCTPLGFVKLFTLVAELVTRQQFLSDLTEEYQVALMEEAAVKKQLDSKGTSGKMTLANGYYGLVLVRSVSLSNKLLCFISAGRNTSRSSTVKPSPKGRS